MPSTKSTVRSLKSQPKPQLTSAEVKRIAEKLAVALEHDAEEIGLLTMLFDYLQTVADNDSCDLEIALYELKKVLFTGTTASDDAQRQFQSNAYAQRGRLLAWPNERSVS